jgi:hypothetical protein
MSFYKSSNIPDLEIFYNLEIFNCFLRIAVTQIARYNYLNRVINDQF